MPFGHFKDLVLAVAVEGRPADGRELSTAAVVGLAPVKRHGFALVTDLEGPTLELEWQADNERAELSWGAGCVDVRLELAARSRVDLEDVSAVSWLLPPGTRQELTLSL